MMILAKLLHYLLQPLSWVTLLLLVAVLRPGRHESWRRAVVALSLALLVAIGWMPLPDALQRALEVAHRPPPASELGRFAGVVVLGGGLDSAYKTEGHDEPVLNDAAERMTTAIALLRKAPGLRLVFTGGEGEVTASGPSEADRARQFFAQQGLDVQRITFESQSRNTYENAVFTARLPGVDKSQRWLLLTSASHMPRALATFAKAGWNVTPWPTDYRTGLHTPWMRYSLSEGAGRWEAVLSEYVGLWVYRLLGRA